MFSLLSLIMPIMLLLITIQAFIRYLIRWQTINNLSMRMLSSISLLIKRLLLFFFKCLGIIICSQHSEHSLAQVTSGWHHHLGCGAGVGLQAFDLTAHETTSWMIIQPGDSHITPTSSSWLFHVTKRVYYSSRSPDFG